MSYLTATLTARCRELHFIEKIVKLPCTVKSLYFTMAEPKRCYLVPGYITLPQTLRAAVMLINKDFDFLRSAGLFTMDVIGSTAFGLKIDSQKDKNNQFVTMAKKIFERNLLNPIFLAACKYTQTFFSQKPTSFNIILMFFVLCVSRIS